MIKCIKCNKEGEIIYNNNNLCKRFCSCIENNICIKCKFFNTSKFCLVCDKNLKKICNICNKCLYCSLVDEEKCFCYKCMSYD